MYKPNFCNECGERVERERWRPWTSRRFCDGCGRRFRRRRFVTPAFVCAGVMCVCFMLGRAGRPAPPPLRVERGEMSLAAAPAAPSWPAGRDERADGAPAPATDKGYGPDGTAGERPTDPGEVVSICGARTKKGTACQRRVRGAGRCWQHRGKAAVLPPSKLVVPG